MHSRIFVIMGVAGSGKSVIGAAFAAAINATFVDGDDFHSDENRSRMAAGVPLTDVLRHDWLQSLRQRLTSAIDRDESVVLACSALKQSYRDVLRSGVPLLQLVFLRGSPALLAERLQNRHGHFMPPSMLNSQLVTLEEPTSLEAAWVCDISETPDTIVAELAARVEQASHDHIT